MLRLLCFALSLLAVSSRAADLSHILAPLIMGAVPSEVQGTRPQISDKEAVRQFAARIKERHELMKKEETAALGQVKEFVEKKEISKLEMDCYSANQDEETYRFQATVVWDRRNEKHEVRVFLKDQPIPHDLIAEAIKNAEKGITGNYPEKGESLVDVQKVNREELAYQKVQQAVFQRNRDKQASLSTIIWFAPIDSRPLDFAFAFAVASTHSGSQSKVFMIICR